MTKNIKKIITTTTTVTSAVAAAAPLALIVDKNLDISKDESSNIDNSNNGGNNIGNNENNNQSKSIIFNGKTYESVEAAAQDYVSQPGNVDQNVYVGDVEKATSKSSPYKTVDLSKLREKDPSKLNKAYKKLSGEYTGDEKEAKKSYLKEPQIKFADNNGGIFDLESDARNSIAKSKLTSSVTYYEIENHNKKDKYGNPEIVKINPLNKDDQEKLKRLSIENAVLNNSSGFDIERFSHEGSSTYKKNNAKGISINEYNSLMNRIKNLVLDTIKNNMWVSPTLSPAPEKPVMGTYFNGGFVVIPASFSVNYNTRTGSQNEYKGLKVKDFINESKALYDKNVFNSKFEKYGNTYGKTNGNNGALFRDAKTKNIFGGQEYEFTLHDQDYIQKNFYMAHPGEAISFAGNGKENNVWFNLGFNQEKIEEVMKPNMVDREVQDLSFKLGNNISDEICKIIPGMDLVSKREIAGALMLPIKKVLTTKIINKNDIQIRNFRNSNDILNYMKVLDERIIRILNDEIRRYSANSSVSASSIDELIGTRVQKETMVVERMNENIVDSIYSVTYNGTPLFRFHSNVMGSYSEMLEFRSSPVNTLKNEIKKSLTNDYEGTMKKFVPNMENVSNLLSRNIANGNKLINEIDRTYFSSRWDKTGNNKTIGFVEGDVDSSWGLTDKNVYFDESMIKELGISEINLNRKLTLFEKDGKELLKMNSGTWGSIHQYNKELKYALNIKDPNQTYKDNILKNRVTDLNDVVQLFEKDKSPKNIYYGEYLNYNTEFNPSLSDPNTRIFSSSEAKDYAIRLHELDTPSRVIQISNHNNDVLINKVITDNSQTAIDAAKEVAINEAISNINVSYDDKYVIYKESSGTEVLLDNKSENLYTLKIKDEKNIIKATYGFMDYQNLYKYLIDYIKFNSTQGGSTTDKIVSFTPESIDANKIQQSLNTYASLQEANDASNDEKFKKYGDAFGITNAIEWDSIINSLTFTSRKTKNGEAVSMDVSLKSGYKLANGNTTFTKNLTYTPGGIEDLPGNNNDDLNAIQRNASNATIISITAAILSIIILEVIVIVTILLNRRNESENEVEKKLVRLSSYKSMGNSTPNINLNAISKEAVVGQKASIRSVSPVGGMPPLVRKSNISNNTNKKDSNSLYSTIKPLATKK